MTVTTTPLANAMTVDVEEYFQVQAFSGVIDRADWEHLPSRLSIGLGRVLDLFARHNARATFFMLGMIAERHPSAARDIVSAGHELASHGWQHERVDSQSPDAFREDARRTKACLEDLTGQEIRGYRAASFSIGPTTPWAHAILKELGYAYSSSIYPIRHDIYGVPDSPRFAYYPVDLDGVVEFPLTTAKLFGKTLPCAGGGYFRLIPTPLTHWAIRRVNKREGEPSIFYFHTWELDPEQPRQRNAPLRSRFRHYLNLSRQEARLSGLLKTFAWDRMDSVYASWLQSDASREATTGG